ncbi:restriction endonuclease subunit S [Crocinitomicaceae bacterium]|nr:restriction endonuclease subunit S [Crocinitomicaceae bacterium]
MLGDHIRILSGFAFKSKEFNNSGEGIPMVRIRDVGKKKSETYYNGEYSDEYLLDNGDLLIGMDGDFRLAEWNGGKALLNQRVCKISTNETTLDRGYMYRMLPRELKRIEDTTSFATVKHLSVKKIKGIDLPLPPLDQQKKIAAILDEADAYRQKTKALITKYDELTQSLFLDMFGDPVTNPKGWEFKTIEQITKSGKGSIKRGPFGGALKKEIFVEDGYLVYEQYHALNNDFSFARYYINEAKFQELKGFEVHSGDIIISCSGVYLGKLAIVPTGAKAGIINQALLKVTLDQTKMTNHFFTFHFRQNRFRETFFDANRGAGIPNFPPMNQFKKFPFIVPPIELQNEFAERVQAIEAQKAQAQESLEKAEELFNSLLQRAFNGELV